MVQDGMFTAWLQLLVEMSGSTLPLNKIIN
jgi:hypothetical protein